MEEDEPEPPPRGSNFVIEVEVGELDGNPVVTGAQLKELKEEEEENDTD